ncbi:MULTISPECIES: alpha/beta fold hydrolase [Flavobacterium]|uniref:Alpha/beta fold hydrolase n=1 Tax=Flavobacterium jumunjinense TaxID=998845 RepID=A0ABV5GJK4_9FLAO|nr:MULTISPECIES: alpha/beta fold hydrolase [Flavobacterium]
MQNITLLMTILKNIIFFLFFSMTSFSQNIFKYEKEIDSVGNYISTVININNTTKKIVLSGTLIQPKNDFDKIVIIVPGSGKDTRHSHFKLATTLLKKGIAVYRFDERGIGESGGEYSESAKDMSEDLNFVFKYLKETNKNIKIGIIGHSLGGIATLEIIQNESIPDFIILIETPVLKNGDFVMNQIQMDYEQKIPKIMRNGKSKEETLLFLEGFFKIISKDSILDKNEFKKYIKEKGFNKNCIIIIQDVALVELLTTDLENVLERIAIPVLYLTGTKDKIINHQKEIDLLRKLNNQNIEVHIFEGLNHWLTDKNAKVGDSLYDMDESVLNKITNWLLKF